ncbi:hypothetical protein DWU98_12575 [Dyella monticola]|uniref:DUF1269 domain-containing protein n=1 Tax=Dyella monticola TaxID=1927958 RepID=A0A370WXK7_9GAMM|nr:hypothetical protein [Dyella monticola]RDS80786.1 hypothetical protein DWU98_12575 [Dyella monticola]
MKKRVVFSVNDMAGARAAMDRARVAGIADEDISLVARSDKSDMVPDERKIVEGDFYPAAAKGAAGGAVVGLIAGLVAVAIPPLGITVAGAFAMAAGGGVLGAWSTALAGSAVDDPVRRQFEDEVEAGRILVVIDAPAENVATARSAIAASGARPLPFEKPTALT